MATRIPTRATNITKAMEVIQVTWTGLAAATTDVGAAESLSDYADKTFQIIGPINSSDTVILEGSNDGTNWSPLSNRQGTLTPITAAGLFTSQDKPIYVRPRVTNGGGASTVSVVLAAHRTDLSLG